jgi:hypothetical protein
LGKAARDRQSDVNCEKQWGWGARGDFRDNDTGLMRAGGIHHKIGQPSRHMGKICINYLMIGTAYVSVFQLYQL